MTALRQQRSFPPQWASMSNAERLDAIEAALARRSLRERERGLLVHARELVYRRREPSPAQVRWIDDVLVRIWMGRRR